MGFFGSDNDEPSRAEELAQQQIELNQAELEQKRQHLYQTRLDIIKGQGAQTFTPDRSSPVQGRRAGIGQNIRTGAESVFNRVMGR